EAAARSTNPAPWDMPGASDAVNLMGLMHPLAAAASQVAHVGNPETIERARAVLVEARRSLYRLLAEDNGSDSPTTGTTSAADPSESGDR
ncbi:MAG: hypothetical protein ABSE70_06320, partial [Candidatus Limnocylindrales bacterium]